MMIIIMMMTPPLFLDQTEAQRAEKKIYIFFNICDAMWDDRTIRRSEFFLNFILVTIGIERA